MRRREEWGGGGVGGEEVICCESYSNPVSRPFAEGVEQYKHLVTLQRSIMHLL